MNSRKSKGLNDMLAYVDAYGNIVSAPPDPGSRQEIKAEDIQISVSKKEDIEQVSSFRTGTISFFNDAKGFGFIRDDESGERIFVHVINLEKPVKENDKVTFETSRSARGLNAVNVKLV